MTLWKSDQYTKYWPPYVPEAIVEPPPLYQVLSVNKIILVNWWFESPALITDLLDELPCLWSPLSQGWAPLSWNFKFVCYIFVCVLFNWSFRLFPTPYKRLLQTILAKQPFKSFFSQNITKVSLRVSENSYSQKQCSQHHSVSFLQIFTKGFE